MQLDLFCGETSPNLASVYARVRGLEKTDGMTLSGRVEGPHCVFSHTLPTTSPLTDLGPGESLLARAVVPDPCFWSPKLPALYRVQVELRRGDRVEATIERQLGMRWFGTRGRNLILEGKRWVLRGVHQDSAVESELDQWRAAPAAMIVDRPNEGLCVRASEQGVMLVAVVRGDPAEVTAQLQRLAQWAAVAVALVDGELPGQQNLRDAAPNLLLGERLVQGRPIQPAAWAQLLFWDVEGTPELPAFARQAAGASVPVVAVRRLEGEQMLPDARAACDRLQRDLVPYGDFAGYIAGGGAAGGWG